MSGIQMVNLCPVVKWSGIQMVRYSNGGLKTELKKAWLGSNMSGILMVRHVM